MGDRMDQCFFFLSDYEWVHNFPVTSIFQHDVFQQMPKSWQECLRKLPASSLNDIPFLGENSADKYPHWPSALHHFLSKSAELSFPRCADLSSTAICPTELKPSLARGMNSKKHHEVSRMASFVHHIAVEAKCDVIVDVGSGLGYLDHILHQLYGHRVLGLETAQCHASAADRRAERQGIDCGGVKSIQFNIEDTAECRACLESILRETNLTLGCQHQSQGESDPVRGETQRVCLIGLHCCGDLSPSMLSLFHHIASIKALCLVSCCYHKMAFSEGRFKNFPLSERGKAIQDKVMERNSGVFISPSTLRLGAQETRCRWKQQTEADHEIHVKHVAFRGLLSLTDEDVADVRQRVRKCDFTDFESFLDSYFGEVLPDSEQSKKKDILRGLHQKHKDHFDLIESFTVLQVILQPVIETLLYEDRIQWLWERGYDSAKAVPIFDEIISPRNLALVTIKAL